LFSYIFFFTKAEYDDGGGFDDGGFDGGDDW
jgi:hypothetical protein